MQPDNNNELQGNESPDVPTTDAAAVPTVPTDAVPEATEAVSGVTPAEEVSVAAPVAAASTRTRVIAAGILIAALAVAAGAYWYLTVKNKTVEVGGVSYPAVVAIVNGEKVGAEALKQSYDQAAAIAVQQGFDPATDESVRKEVETQALTILINTVLMKQEAAKGGFEPTDEQIQAEVSRLETQFGGAEQLATVLAGAGLDDAGMRADLRDQIAVDMYLQSTPEIQAITVSDEEVRAYYDIAAGQMEEVPPFEEVEAQIRDQLLYDKRGAATGAVIERVRAESTIETKI